MFWVFKKFFYLPLFGICVYYSIVLIFLKKMGRELEWKQGMETVPLPLSDLSIKEIVLGPYHH